MSEHRPLPVVPHAKPAMCRLLRTKASFGTFVSGDEGWDTGDSATANYWCLKTMETVGPDDRLAHPHQCVASRACFTTNDE